VAIANANFGFSPAPAFPPPAPAAPVASVDDVIGICRFVELVFAFGKERLRYHVFFRRPIAEVLQPATLAAERKLDVRFGIRQLLANGAPALHEA
jgi:hypothetical protein